jgi:hypothetical protein
VVRRPGAHAPALAIFLLALSGAVLVLAAPESGFWDGTLAEARALSDQDGLPVLLLFPAAGKADPPRPLADGPATRAARGRFHPARVRSGEVEELLSRFQVAKLPAVALLDRHGGLVERWEGATPPDLWSQIDRAARRLKGAEESLSQALRDSRAALEREDFAAALGAAREVRARSRPGYSEPEAAAAVESAVLLRAERELKKVLAAEGIAADSKLEAELARFRDRFPHPAVKGRVERELERIRSRTVGGARRG